MSPNVLFFESPAFCGGIVDGTALPLAGLHDRTHEVVTGRNMAMEPFAR
jgi:hypothetical protein